LTALTWTGNIPFSYPIYTKTSLLGGGGGLQRLGRESGFSDPCNIELNNVWVYTFLLPRCSVSRCLITYRECLSYLFSLEIVRLALFSFWLAGNIIKIFINKTIFFCEGGTQISKRVYLNKIFYVCSGIG